MAFLQLVASIPRLNLHYPFYQDNCINMYKTLYTYIYSYIYIVDFSMDFARPTIFSATIQIAVTLSIWAWQSWAVSYSIQCCGNIEMVSGSRWWFTAISAPLPPRLYKLFADKSSLFGGSHWWPCCHMFKHLPSGKLTWQWKIHPLCHEFVPVFKYMFHCWNSQRVSAYQLWNWWNISHTQSKC